MKFYKNRKYLAYEKWYRIILGVIVTALGPYYVYQVKCWDRDCSTFAYGVQASVFLFAVVYAFFLRRSYVTHRDDLKYGVIEVSDGVIRYLKRDEILGSQPLKSAIKLVVYRRIENPVLISIYFNKYVPFVIDRIHNIDDALDIILKSVGGDCKVVSRQKLF